MKQIEPIAKLHNEKRLLEKHQRRLKGELFATTNRIKLLDQRISKMSKPEKL